MNAFVVVALLVTAPDLLDCGAALRRHLRPGAHRARTTHGHLGGAALASAALAYRLVHRSRPAHLR